MLSFTLVLTALVLYADAQCGLNRMGCWRDNLDRAIGGGIRFSNPTNVVQECRKFAIDNGWSVFAIEVGKECYTAADAGNTYKKHGDGQGCHDGTGGSWLMDVYSMECPNDCKVKNLGCWKDKEDRAINGGIRFSNPDNVVEQCKNYAMKAGWSVFSVQVGKECFTAADAGATYNRYGESTDCEDDGTGGKWANSVYSLDCGHTPEPEVEPEVKVSPQKSSVSCTVGKPCKVKFSVTVKSGKKLSKKNARICELISGKPVFCKPAKAKKGVLTRKVTKKYNITTRGNAYVAVVNYNGEEYVSEKTVLQG